LQLTRDTLKDMKRHRAELDAKIPELERHAEDVEKRLREG